MASPVLRWKHARAVPRSASMQRLKTKPKLELKPKLKLKLKLKLRLQLLLEMKLKLKLKLYCSLKTKPKLELTARYVWDRRPAAEPTSVGLPKGVRRNRTLSLHARKRRRLVHEVVSQGCRRSTSRD